MWKKTALPLILALLATGASASDVPDAQRDVRGIRTQQADIRRDVLAETPRYAHLDAASRTALRGLQDRVDGLLTDVDSTADLPERRQIELFNALESISALVNQEPDGRVECWRERPVGTMQAQTRCSTAGGLRAQNLTYRRVWTRAGQR